MGPELIPLLVSGLGTAATLYAQNEQQDKQRSILNQQLENEGAASKKATDMTLQEGQRFTQGNREQALQDAEQKTYNQTQADLTGAGGAGVATAADNANVSDDFVKTKAARAIEEGNRLSTIARQTAKARAPGALGLDDSLSMANLSGNLQNVWGTTKNMANAGSLDAQSVQEPWYGGLGRVAQAAGGAMAAGGYGKGDAFAGTGVSPSGVDAWDRAWKRARANSGGINFGDYSG